MCVDQVISIPDNDYLSALVATTMQADLLILLSDVDGECEVKAPSNYLVLSVIVI